MPTEHNYDVIVIGAGISGLTAAYNIKKRNSDVSVLVLEAKDRVGGRTYTVPLVTSGGTDHFDIGGQWVGRCQIHVTQMMKELGLKSFPQYTNGKKLHQVAERKIRSYQGVIPKLSFLSLIDLQMSMSKMENLRKQLCVHHPFSHPKAEEWDAMSISSYGDKVLYTNAAKVTIDLAMRTVFGCETNQISFLYFLLYLQMADGLEKLVEAVDDTAQEARIDGGAQQISLELSKRIGNDNIKLNTVVSSIQQTESGVTVTTENGWQGNASRIIIAMPPKAIERITFTPRLQDDRMDFMKHMPMGNVIKVIVTYESAFWRNMGLSGEAVSDGGVLLKNVSPSFPLSVIYDATSASGSPALLSFLVGQIAVEWNMRPAKERKQAVIDHFKDFFGNEAGKFLDYIEQDWTREPHSIGGPVSYVTVGGMKNFSQAIRKPDGKIHFAGTETATTWTGYMSGAIQAGERASSEVLSHLKPESLTADDYATLKAHTVESKYCPTCSAKRKGGYKRYVLFVGFLFCSASAFFINKAIASWW